jgi:hypothetical protein
VPFSGEFDATLSPVVRVCRWVSDACAGDDIVFTRGAAPQSVMLAGSAYLLVWSSTGNLTVGDIYRLRVYASDHAGRELGHADLAIVAQGNDLRTVPAGFNGLVAGNPFVVRFRIQTDRGSDGVAPSAVNDASTESSAPGDAYHGAFNATYTVAAPGLRSNDNVGAPAATIASFGVLSNGLTEVVTAHTAGASVSIGGSGSLRVNADGSVELSPPAGFTGYVVFVYRLQNEAGSSDATASIAIGRRPATANDTYSPTLIGNVPINTATSTQFSMLTNDPGDGMTASLVSATNGTAVVASNGKFTFTPNAGFSGPASITYRATNGFGDAPTTATVSLNVGAPMWFVNAGAATNGNGTYGSPFNCLSGPGCFDPSAPDAADQTIFLYSGAYTGGITLLAGQKLIGQGSTVSVGTAAGLSWPADASPQPATGGTPPVLTSLAPATHGLTISNGNTLRGFNIGNATGTALVGANFGTLVVADVGINTTGQAIDLNNGSVSGSLASITSTGGANNVSLTNLATTGTFVLGTGALSGATGDAFLVNGGTGAVSYAGSVTSTTALAAHIIGKTGGTVTLAGDINPAVAARGIDVSNNGGGTTVTFSGSSKKISTGSATGVSVANNAGATVNFSGGGLAVVTTTGTAFAANGGGSVSVTGTNNTLSSTGGVALNVDNTTIGAAGLVFRSISATGGSNGIILKNTGSNGGLSITGIANTTGSGGTIQNMLGADGTSDGVGVYLENTRAVLLNYLNLSDHANYAIRGIGVVGFAMDRVRITGTNGSNPADGEGSILLTELTGSGSISRSFVSGSVSDNIRVVNTTGTLTLLAFAQDTVQDNSSVSGGDGISILARSAATMTASVGSSFFKGNRGKAIRSDANATASLAITASSNTIVAGVTNQGTKGIEISATGDAQLGFDVDGNKVGTDGALNAPLSSTSIDVLGDSRSTLTGKVRNNQVWNAGSAIQGYGIRVFANDTSNIRASVSSNNVTNVGMDYGILVEASGADTQVPPAGTGTIDIGLTGNTVNVLSFALDAMRVQSRHNNRVCARISGNSSTNTALGFFGLLVRQTNASSFKIEGLAGPAGSFLAGMNPAVTDGVADNGGTFGSVSVNSCNIPQ